MQIINGDSRYGLPHAADGTLLTCVRLDDGERAELTPAHGVAMGNIRVGKRAFNCAFVLGQVQGCAQPVWVYMSKGRFVDLMAYLSARNRFTGSITVQYAGRVLTFDPPSPGHQAAIAVVAGAIVAEERSKRN